MRFKVRSERNEQSHSERSCGNPLRELEDNFAGFLDFAFAPLGMTTGMSLTRVIEALLFSAQKPLSIREITAAIKEAEGDVATETPNEFTRVKNAEVAAALEELKVEYIQQSRGFQLVEKAVRGVNIDGVLQTLMERGLVKIAGRAEIPGRPLLYETTQFFLDHFGLRNL